MGSALRAGNRGEDATAHLKPTDKSWRVDETYVRVKGRWFYLYWALDSQETDPCQAAFPGVQLCAADDSGYATMHKIQKGQVRWLRKGDIRMQNRFIDQVFGLAA
jgi:hypothetical protein